MGVEREKGTKTPTCVHSYNMCARTYKYIYTHKHKCIYTYINT